MSAHLENYAAAFAALEFASSSEVQVSDALTSVRCGLAKHIEQRLQPHGFTYSEFLVLTTIMASQDDNAALPGKLSAETGIKFSNVSRICEKLFHRALLVRRNCSTDRRTRWLSLSAEGERVAYKLLLVVGSICEALFANFTDDEKWQMTTQMMRLVRSIDSEIRDLG
jgi:DNA-binding MarR family transcriptional regulator